MATARGRRRPSAADQQQRDAERADDEAVLLYVGASGAHIVLSTSTARKIFGTRNTTLRQLVESLRRCISPRRWIELPGPVRIVTVNVGADDGGDDKANTIWARPTTHGISRLFQLGAGPNQRR